MKISKESSGINLVDSENSIYYLNFQGCFTVQLSRFFAVAFASVINIISNFFDVVNTFLIFFFVSLSRQQILSYQIHSILSILFFIFFKKVFLAFVTMQRINFHAYHPPTDKRRRRDLNPRAAINDLHPFQGCPFGQLGYFSELHYILIRTDFHQ